MHCQYKMQAQLYTHSPKIIKSFSCSSQLSMKFKLPINREIIKFGRNFRFKLAKPVIYMCILLINVKMPTIVGILTFMSRIIFSLI